MLLLFWRLVLVFTGDGIQRVILPPIDCSVRAFEPIVADRPLTVVDGTARVLDGIVAATRVIQPVIDGAARPLELIEITRQ